MNSVQDNPFTYTVTDGTTTAQTTLTITVDGVNDAPVAHDDAGSAAAKGANATGNVITTGPGADTDVDNLTSSLTVASFRTGTVEGAGTAGTVGNPAGLVGAHGTLTLNADGSYTYVVNDNDGAVQALNVGDTITDSFNYTVQDPGGLTDTAVLTITIHGADDAPVAHDDAGSAAAKGANATGNVITTGPGADTDVDNLTSSLTVASFRTGTVEGAGTAGTVGNPAGLVGAHGTLTLNADGSYTYMVNDNDGAVQALNVGDTITDSFNYTVQDPGGLTDTAVLTITIHGADDAPVAHDDAGSATEKGGTNNATAGANATGNVITTGPGADTDVDNLTSSLTVASFRTGTVEGAGTAGTVGNPAGLVGAHGTLTLNADGSYTYVVNDNDGAVQALNVGDTITDSFNYTVQDPGGLTDTAVLTITIHGADDAPVAHDDAGSAAAKGANATGNVITTGPGADTDVDNLTSSLTVASFRTGTVEGAGTAGTVGNPAGLVGAHGTLTLNADGSYTYVVNDNDGAVQALNVGDTITDSFNYTVQDPGGLTDTAVLTITIHGADDAPVAHDDAGSATEKGGTNNATAGANATGNVITTGRAPIPTSTT